jgi:ribosomal protein L11 methyltransferase
VPLLAYRITVPEAREDEAMSVLWELGTEGVEVQLGAEGRVALLAYFSEDQPLEPLTGGLSPLGAEIQRVAVAEVDWVARFRESFRAFSVGCFRIAPPWAAPERLERHERLLLVDPGRAFGTGTHETTRLCLRALEALVVERTPERVLDVGTGTGLLAIAAARLGASFVVGTDTDPDALLSARHHARLNDLALAFVRDDTGAALRQRSFDLVLANLTAPLLRAAAARIAGLVAPSGKLVLSGLLSEEAGSVRAAYATLGSPREPRDGEWSALIFTAP